VKLILVDDNKSFRGAIKLFLELELGHEIIGEANSGEEFLKLNNVEKADVILMDIVMGDMDGFLTAKKILNRHSWLKIIAVTMHFENVFLMELIQAGFKGYLNKTDVYRYIDQVLNDVADGKLFFQDNLKISNKPLTDEL